MCEHQVIEQELDDLTGLLCDLYRRVAASEPALASQVGHALGTAAVEFNALSGAGRRG